MMFNLFLLSFGALIPHFRDRMNLPLDNIMLQRLAKAQDGSEIDESPIVDNSVAAKAPNFNKRLEAIQQESVRINENPRPRFQGWKKFLYTRDV
jgi:hypothetical protein